MLDNEAYLLAATSRTPWNKGKLIGAKPPLRPKHVWAIRTRLMIKGQSRDLAMFNLAIDSKLRGCDVVALKVEDVAPNGSFAPTNEGDVDLSAHRQSSIFGPSSSCSATQRSRAPSDIWALRSMTRSR